MEEETSQFVRERIERFTTQEYQNKKRAELKSTKWTWRSIAGFHTLVDDDHGCWLVNAFDRVRNGNWACAVDTAVKSACEDEMPISTTPNLNTTSVQGCQQAVDFFANTPFPPSENGDERINYMRLLMKTSLCKDSQFEWLRHQRRSLYYNLDNAAHFKVGAALSDIAQFTNQTKETMTAVNKCKPV